MAFYKRSFVIRHSDQNESLLAYLLDLLKPRVGKKLGLTGYSIKGGQGPNLMTWDSIWLEEVRLASC